MNQYTFLCLFNPGIAPLKPLSLFMDTSVKTPNFVKNLVMKKILVTLALGIQSIAFSQSLEIVPLGVYGGGDESNLSAYLIGEEGSNRYLSLDAGTIQSGIKKAIEKKTFTTTADVVLKEYITGYFISHGHLDHLSGMIINSPEDSKKPIYGIPSTIETLKNRYFTLDAWANFANEGEAPILNKYQYNYIQPNTSFQIEGTNLKATLFELSHVNPQKSSALLIENKTNAVLYLGDTGADRVEQTDHLSVLWKGISPLIKNGKLKTILLEVSFPNSQPEHLLFGHLTPQLIQEEMQKLAMETGLKNLNKLTIIVTHIKPKGTNEATIKNELKASNPLSLHYIFPQQGERIVIKP